MNILKDPKFRTGLRHALTDVPKDERRIIASYIAISVSRCQVSENAQKALSKRLVRLTAPCDFFPSVLAERIKYYGRRHHVLKTYDDFFCAVRDGAKTFECQFNDRGFMVGDMVTLIRQAGNDAGAAVSDDVLTFEIGTVMHGPAFGISPGWCVFSLLPVD